jgi:hypothetical protein
MADMKITNDERLTALSELQFTCRPAEASAIREFLKDCRLELPRGTMYFAQLNAEGTQLLVQSQSRSIVKFRFDGDVDQGAFTDSVSLILHGGRKVVLRMSPLAHQISGELTSLDLSPQREDLFQNFLFSNRAGR